jgi:ribosomal protein L37E
MSEPATPPGPSKRDLADLMRHIVVTEVRPGDVLVFEVDHSMSDKELAAFKESVREVHGEGVRVTVVERGRFAGVIRHEHQAETRCPIQWLSEESCPVRVVSAHPAKAHECGRPSCHDRDHECVHCGHRDGSRMIDVSTNADVFAGRPMHIPGEPRAKGVDMDAATEAARQAARAWGGHGVPEALPYMVAAAVRAVIEGGQRR